MSEVVEAERAAQLLGELVDREWLIRWLTSESVVVPGVAADVADALISAGLVVEGAPPARKILTDAQTFAERTILAELTVRLFRFYIMGSLVLPDTPAAMDWLRSFVDGTNGQGPLGAGPMLWPVMIPSAASLLTRWGFEPTPSVPAYVIKRRKDHGQDRQANVADQGARPCDRASTGSASRGLTPT